LFAETDFDIGYCLLGLYRSSLQLKWRERRDIGWGSSRKDEQERRRGSLWIVGRAFPEAWKKDNDVQVVQATCVAQDKERFI